LVFV
jgi:hypothetical protein